MNHESNGHTTNATPIHCTKRPASSHLVDLWSILYVLVHAAQNDQTWSNDVKVIKCYVGTQSEDKNIGATNCAGLILHLLVPRSSSKACKKINCILS